MQQAPYQAQNVHIINTNPGQCQPIPHQNPYTATYRVFRNPGQKPLPKISRTFSKVQLSIEGTGTLSMISLPTRTIKTGFESLETELRKWI